MTLRKKNKIPVKPAKPAPQVKSPVAVVLLILLAGFLVMFSSSGYAKTRKPKLSPEHQEFFRYARYLFTKSEREIFKHLTSNEARERFIKNFWDIRDPNPYTEENEFKIEIEERYEYVSKYFREGPMPGWETDRGRIYILLGAPTAVQEDRLNIGAVIQWYYDDLNIYVRFNDYKGFGIFELDVNTVSLNLLDVLHNNKYFIMNHEGKVKWNSLDFNLGYDGKTREILVEVEAKNLTYEDAPAGSSDKIAKIKVDLVIYSTGREEDFTKFSEIKNITVAKEKLLEKDATISFKIPYELPKAKVKIDAIIADYLGDAVQRKFITLNTKE